MVECDALAVGDDVGELGEGGEGEEFADGGEDAAVDDAHGGYEEPGDYQPHRRRQSDGEYHGMEFCFHLLQSYVSLIQFYIDQLQVYALQSLRCLDINLYITKAGY